MALINCKECGKEISDEASFCPNCGYSVNNSNATEINNQSNNYVKTNGFAVAGFVISLVSLLINFWGIVGLLGTIFSAIALNEINKHNEKGKGMAIAGLIIGIIGIIWGIIVLAAIFSY